jgi:hypothetical protein
MESWVATVPITDKLDHLASCVFHQVQSGNFTFYFCRLCSRNHFNGEQLDDVPSGRYTKRAAHLADPLHVQRADILVQERNRAINRFCWLLQHKEDVSHYRSPALNSFICYHIFGSPASQDGTEQAILQLLKELRLAEPLVQLELALWKAACELSPLADNLSSLEWKTWSCSGWKQLKSAKRSDPLTGVTALVAPFLGLKKNQSAHA